MPDLITGPATARDRLQDLIDHKPDQCVAVAICGTDIKIAYKFKDERHLDAMLKALQDELAKTMRMRKKLGVVKL